MNNEIRQFKVQANDPYFTANKWNETLDYSINFEKIISNILGPKFKGIYKVSGTYNKFDYVWYNDSIYQILGNNNTTMKSHNSYGLTNVYQYKDGLLGLNSRKEIVYYTTSENVLINNTFDQFCYDYVSNNCYAVKDNRIYSINLETKEVKLYNMIFLKDFVIEKILCDEGNIFVKCKNGIYRGSYLHSENTLFDTLYTAEQIIDFDISHDNVFVVEHNKITALPKTIGITKQMIINSNIEITTDVRICAINNNTFMVYNGRSNIFTFFDNGSGIYNLESTVVNYDGFNQGIHSITSNKDNVTICSLNNTIVTIPANKYSIEKIDMKHVLHKNALVEMPNSGVACHISYKNGYYTHLGNSILKSDECNFKYVNFIPTVENNSKITFDFNTISFYKAIMLKLKTSASGQHIGTFYYNGSSYNITLPIFNGNEITIFLEYKDTNEMIATFVTENQMQEIPLVGVNNPKSNILQITSNFTTMISEVALFMSILPASLKDYLASNNIIPTKDIVTDPIPYTNVHLDQDGNLPVKIKNNSILKDSNGISVNISDSIKTNDREVAFSTAGAMGMYDEITTSMNEAFKEMSSKRHTHEFREILNVPTATQTIPGITTLAYSVSDSNLTAVTPKAVKEYTTQQLNEYKHPHPYLNVETGGYVNGQVGCKHVVSETGNINSIEGNNIKAQSVNSATVNSDSMSVASLRGTNITTNYIEASRFTLGGYVITIEQ